MKKLTVKHLRLTDNNSFNNEFCHNTRYFAFAIFYLLLLLATAQNGFAQTNGKIAFQVNNSNIHTINSDGTMRMPLTLNGDADNASEPVWSPDGSRVAFVCDNGICIINADGTGLTTIPNTMDDDYPSWSPDGTRIAFVRPQSGNSFNPIFVINLDGSNLTQLTSGGSSSGHSWSPDGSKLVFSRSRQANNIVFSDLYIINSNGGTPTLLLSGHYFSPDWSPDGMKIVCEGTNNGEGINNNIYVVNTNGTGLTRLTDSQDFSPAWSPDGSKIVYASNVTAAETREDIFVMNADGSSKVNITNTPNQSEENPDWQPALTCSVQQLSPITDPVAQQFEAQNGNVVDTTELTQAMTSAYNDFRTRVQIAGGQLRLNSAYRPPAYQIHLREVWDRWQRLKNNTLPQCQILRTVVQAEVNRHGLGNLKTRPGGVNGKHTQGLAIDVNFGATGLPTQTIVNLAAQSGLIRPLVAKDPVHFILGSQQRNNDNSPTVEEDSEEVEHSSANPQAVQTIPTANVFVTVTKQIVNNNYVYSYRVRNNDSRPILAFEVGYNDSTSASQLLIPPVDWNYDTGLSASSTASPTGWSSNLITTDESEFHSLEWRTENTNQNIQPSQTLVGFSVVLPQDDITYLNSSLKIVFADGSVASAKQNSAPQFDFDGDGKTDISIFRPAPGEWWYLRSSDGGNRTFQFGNSSDKLVPADFTGDGKTDIAIVRPSTNEWFVLRSEDGSFYSFPFGANGDVPVPADYDGDGKADAAVYRPSTQTWFISRSTGGTTIQTFGAAGDLPTVADYDGDSKADLAIYRPSVGQWWLLRSNLGIVVYQFGNSSDKPVQGDYTGDGKADVAFFRPSTNEWFVLRSENASFYSFPFGASGDIPSPGDYDGDGKMDAAVFRPSTNTWFAQRATSGILIQGFGAAGDKPIPNVFVP